MKHTTENIINQANARGYITENEINLLKRRANRGEDMSYIYEFCTGVISEEQTQKGKIWILSKLAKKDGSPRKGCENFRELIELAKDENTKFSFDGFYNIGIWNSFYVPIYTLSNEFRTFSYYLSGGTPQIY